MLVCRGLHNDGRRSLLAANVFGDMSMPRPSDSIDGPPKKRRKGLTREQRQDISEGMRGLWRNPAYREKMLKAIREGRAREKKPPENKTQSDA